MQQHRVRLIALPLAIFLGWLGTAWSVPSAAQAVLVPTIDCQSNPSIFNTGVNAALNGVQPFGSDDRAWEAAGPFPVTNPKTSTSLPAAGTVWRTGVVGNYAPGAWAASPFGNAEWVTAAERGSSPDGDWYYRYRFNLADEVTPSAFSLSLNFLADNGVAQVWVNDVAQSSKTTGIPQARSGDPYQYGGFVLANAANTVLNHDWRSGANSIVVQIKSGASFEGFDVQTRASVTCPRPAVEVALTASPTRVNTVGDVIDYRAVVTNSGNVALTGVGIDPGSFTGRGTAPRYVCASGTLAVGAETTCTASYTVVAADLADQTIVSAVTGVGTGAGLAEATRSEPTTSSVSVFQTTVAISGGATAVTDQPARTISGSSNAAQGSTVTVTVGGQTLTGTVGSDGTWSVQPEALEEGEYLVVASVVNTDGGTATDTQELTIDTTAPALAVDGGPDRLVDDATPTITGTTDAAPGSTVTVTVDGQTLTATVEEDQSWTVSPAALTDGSYPVVARITDPAGNSATATQNLTVDTAAPELTIDGGLQVNTNNVTPTITGTTDAAVGSTVTVTVGDQTLTATVVVGGTWTVTATTLSGGIYPVTASVTDPAGNTSTADQDLTIDTTPPELAVDGGPVRLVDDATPTISGTTDAAPGSTVTVTVGGQTLTATVEEDQSWTVTPTTLTDDTYPVVARITDAAGNTTTANQDLTVDTTAPELAIDGSPEVVTNDTTPTITGTTDAPVGSTVTVTVGGQTLTATVTDGGVWNVTFAALTDDTYLVSARITDLAGNTTTATSSLVVDTAAPDLTIDGGTERSTSDRTPQIGGTSTAPPGSTVRVTVDGESYSTNVQPDGTWSVTTAKLKQGVYAVSVTITDPAGNVTTGTQTLTVEVADPVVTSPTDALPATGGPAAAWLLTGLLLVAGGGATLAVRRRRTDQR